MTISKSEFLSGLNKYTKAISDSLNTAYTLPTATANQKGGVKIGKGLLLTGDSINVTLEDHMAIFEQDLSDMDGKIDFVSNKVDGLDEHVGSLSEEVSALDSKVAEFDSKIGNFDGDTDILKDEIANLDYKVSSLSDKVEGIDGEYYLYDSKMASFDNKLDTVAENVNDCNDKVISLKAGVDSVGGDVEQLGNKVDEFGTQLASYDEKFIVLDNKVDSFTETNSDLKAKVADLDSSVKDLDNDVELCEDKVADFSAKIDAFDKTITKWESGIAYTAGYGLSLADGEFSVTLQGGNGGLSAVAIENINDFFTPKDELKDRYAEAPFNSENIFGLDLSNLIDGTNFELDTENLTDGAVTRIRSGTASYNVNNGISRGYVEVKTICKCTLTVTYSISSQASYDFGGCIITENAPNTEFTYANLKAANFFKNAGKSLNQTATYTLAANKTYYLNFGYAKNASTNTNDDRFYIHSIRIVPEKYYSCPAECFFVGASDTADSLEAKIAAYNTLTTAYNNKNSAYNTLQTAATNIANSLGGKFYPLVSGLANVTLNASANLKYIENRIAKAFANTDWSVPQFDDVTLCGDVVVSINCDGGSPQKWSLVGSGEQFVTLVSDTAAVTNEYKICPLSDSGGFIYRSATNTVGYAAGVSIQPFVITSAGKPSLGTATSIIGAQNATYPSQEIYMVRAMYDPTHIVFYVVQETANGFDYKYTTIAFQANTNTYTRTKALTALGTYYKNDGKNIQSWHQPLFHSNYPVVLCPICNFNSLGEFTSWTYKLFVHHGLYRAVPVLLSLDSEVWDYSSIICMHASRRTSTSKATCYIVVENPYTSKRNCPIYVFDATNNRICPTSWTLSDVIDDFLL